MNPAIDNWANFLANEKLTADRVGDKLEKLIDLAEKLAKEHGQPKLRPHPVKIQARRLVVRAAMDMGFDLSAIRYKGKVAMGRGLLDAWNEEYKLRHGSNVGTLGEWETKRRNIVTKLSRSKHEMPDLRQRPAE